MTITIGERTLAISRPADLVAKLVAATGCSAAELAGMLSWRSPAAQVARALAPMIAAKDALPLDELAGLIADADPVPVAEQVVVLLGPQTSEAADGQA